MTGGLPHPLAGALVEVLAIRLRGLALPAEVAAEARPEVDAQRLYATAHGVGVTEVPESEPREALAARG